ncbi:hypothetical protein ES705_28148 [subsurface metagenome]
MQMQKFLSRSKITNIMNKYLWLIIPVIVMCFFKGLVFIDPIVTDSSSFLEATFPDPIRPLIYPLFLNMVGKHIILFQTILWAITGIIIYRKTGPIELILYSFTTGLLYLSQKILAETLFVFFLTLVMVSNKNFSFIWFCVLALIKPIAGPFILVLIILRTPNIKYLAAGLTVILAYSLLMKTHFNTWQLSTMGEYCYNHYIGDGGIKQYLSNIIINSVGKTVGIESLFFQRISQVQDLGYTIIGLLGLFLWRKNPMYLFPVTLVLIAGISSRTGDRLHIVLVPVCLMIVHEFQKNFTINGENNNEIPTNPFNIPSR